MRPARRPSSRPLRPPSPDDAPTGRADLYRSPSRSLRRPSVRIPACGAAPESGIGTRETGTHPPSEARPRHRLRCRSQDVRALLARPSEMTGRIDTESAADATNSVEYEGDLDGGDVAALDAEVRHASAGQ